MLAKRLQGGGLVIVDCEQGLEMANPERVPQDRSQADDLELPPDAFDIPGQPGKLAQHGTGKIPDTCEIQQDPAAAVINEQTVQFLADLMDQGRLEHQSGLHEIDHRNTIDILHLQMLERRC